MRRSGLLVWKILQKLGEMAVEGVSHAGSGSGGGEDDGRCRREARIQGLLVQAAGEQYRYVLCTSVNEEIVHGMPSEAGFEEGRYLFRIDTGV